jgi:hypothetical protein
MQRRLVQRGEHLRGDWRGFPVRGLRAARPTLLHHHAPVRKCDGRLPLQWLASVLPEQQHRHAGPARRRLRPEPWFGAGVRGLDPHVRLERDDVVLHRVRRPRQPLLWHHLRDGPDLHRGDLSGRSPFVRRKQRQRFGRRQQRWRARMRNARRLHNGTWRATELLHGVFRRRPRVRALCLLVGVVSDDVLRGPTLVLGE